MSRKKGKAEKRDTPAESPVTEPAAAADNGAADNVAAEPAPGPEALQAERDDLLARLQRVSADYLNYQKRVQRDIEEVRQYATAELVRAMLDVLDDLERAVEHARNNHDSDDPLLVGTDLVYKKALDVLKRFDVEPIATEGRMFDPAVHQALMRLPTADVPPMTIVSEAQRGYVLKGRTIRPAKVVVATAIEEAESEPGEAAEPGDGGGPGDGGEQDRQE